MERERPFRTECSYFFCEGVPVLNRECLLLARGPRKLPAAQQLAALLAVVLPLASAGLTDRVLAIAALHKGLNPQFDQLKCAPRAIVYPSMST